MAILSFLFAVIIQLLLLIQKFFFKKEDCEKSIEEEPSTIEFLQIQCTILKSQLASNKSSNSYLYNRIYEERDEAELALEDQKDFFQQELRDRERRIENLSDVRIELSSYIRRLGDVKKDLVEKIRELDFTQSRLQNKSEELEKSTIQLQLYKELLKNTQTNDFAPLDEQRKTPCPSLTVSYRTRLKIRSFLAKLERVKAMEGVESIAEEDEEENR